LIIKLTTEFSFTFTRGANDIWRGLKQSQESGFLQKQESTLCFSSPGVSTIICDGNVETSNEKYLY